MLCRCGGGLGCWMCGSGREGFGRGLSGACVLFGYVSEGRRGRRQEREGKEPSPFSLREKSSLIMWDMLSMMSSSVPSSGGRT